MNRLALTGELLHKAYVLAFFIHGDEEVATRIVVRAAGKLEVAVSAQNKRLYYQPVSRTLSTVLDPAVFRHKIWLSDVHLLQRLIYIESESYEKLKEQRETTADEEDLVVHFIKHLVRITFRRNSFYVALGLSRLLYNYSTAETMDIYNAVVRDPERVKDDYYYRSRKGVLMSELKDRFGDFLRTYRGPRGEERFLVPERPGEGAELAKECLSFFTPWATPCLVPDGFDPIFAEIPGLVTQGPNEEPRAEANRIHALTHPRCYQRLISALGFLSPAEKLAVPRFFLSQSNDKDGPRSRRRRVPEFDAERLNAIRNELAEISLRRKKSASGLLRVRVDGVEHACLDLSLNKSIRFTLSRNAELVEITTTDAQGELLLATQLIDYDSAGRTSPAPVYRIVLEGGQEISLRVSPMPDDTDRVVMDVRYKETSLFRAAAHFLGGLMKRLTVPLHPRSWRSATVLLTALGLVLLVVGLIGLRLSWHRGNRVPQARAPVAPQPSASMTATPPALVSHERDASILPGTNPGNSSKPNDGTAGVREKKTATPQRPRENNETVQHATVAKGSSSPVNRGTTAEPAASDPERTRGATGVSPAVSLLGVKRVFVEPMGDLAQSKIVTELVLNGLRASGRFDIAPTRDDADAVFKISVRIKPGEATPESRQVSVEALLVNANGDVLWPQKSRRARSSYSGAPDNVATSIVTNLLRDIRQTRKQ